MKPASHNRSACQNCTLIVSFVRTSVYHISSRGGPLRSALRERWLHWPHTILKLLTYTGWAVDIAACLDVCRDTRNNANLGSIADVLRGEKRRTRLMFASAMGDLSRARVLLASRSVDVNRRDLGGRTTLSWASSNGHLAVVRELMDRGALALLSPSRGEAESAIPLHAAALAGHAHVVRRAARTSTCGVPSWTPLMLASYRCRAEVVVVLLECGANVNAHAADT